MLNNVADLLQIKDEQSFRYKAYRRVAQSVYRLDQNIHDLYESNRLYDIAGVGNSIKTVIEEIIEKGTCQLYEQLQSEMGDGLLTLLKIPGLGHKAIRTLSVELGVQNIEDLKNAVINQEIRKLPGMGIKTEQNILQGIAEIEQGQYKVSLAEGLTNADQLLTFILSLESVVEASTVGSIRRGKPLVSDIDILVAAHDEQLIRRKLRQYRGVNKIETEEKGHIGGKLLSGIEFEVIIVPPEEYYQSLLWTTGSKKHRERLFSDQQRAFFNGASSEKEIYEQMGLCFIPPELREDQGEFEAAISRSIPNLVGVNDLQGDLHVHSDWSDGQSNLKQLATVAREMGYSYLGITDHSQSLAIARGLTADRLSAQAKEIDELNQSWDDFKLFKGIEVDILKNGELDFPDEVLNDLDLVIASIHSHFKLDLEKQTDRMLEAIKSDQINILGHLTGRLLQRRKPYELDVDKIFEEASRHHVVMELNADPERLDINEELCRKAVDYDLKIAVNSDAHHKNDLAMIRYGLLTARRGWLRCEDIINTWSTEELKAYLKE